MKNKLTAFTLAEVLITLAIIGTIAALTVPSVITAYQQKEYETGIKKAVETLNQAITLNMALEDRNPSEAPDTFAYFARRMNVIKSTTNLREWNEGFAAGSAVNAALWTADGMRFEFGMSSHANNAYDEGDVTVNGENVHINASSGIFEIVDSERYNLAEEGQKVYACISHLGGFNVEGLAPAQTATGEFHRRGSCMGCGSNGLKNNPNQSIKAPCLIAVDVNGDKKPSPPNANCKSNACADSNRYKWPKNDKKLTDMFFVMITDRGATPLSVKETSEKKIYANVKQAVKN